MIWFDCPIFKYFAHLYNEGMSHNIYIEENIHMVKYKTVGMLKYTPRMVVYVKRLTKSTKIF